MAKRITLDDVVNLLETRGYKLKGDFINTNVDILIECPQGHVKEIKYHKFKKGHGCTQCTDRKINGKKAPTKWTEETVKKKLTEYNYSLVSGYINTTTKILIECPKGHQTEKYFGHFLKGYLCKKCAVNSNNQILKEQSKEEFDSLLFSKGYIRLEEYINSFTPVLLKCAKGHYIKQSFSNFKKGVNCKGCQMSSYENTVYNILKKLEMIAINEYVHPKLSNKRFDFMIVDESFNNIIMAIEVDGEQHYREAFGKENSLKWNEKRDDEKDIFCKQENIQLVRIPYFKIEDTQWIQNQILRYGKGE